MNKKLLFSAILFLSFFSLEARAEESLSRKFSLGGQLTGGNTQVQSLHFDFNINRNRKWREEATFKGSFDREISTGIDTQFRLWSAYRYARSLNKSLFNYIKLEATHDRFQNIELRFIPAIGVGNWFADSDDLKFKLEGAFGYQKEYFIDKSHDEAWLITLSSDLNYGLVANDLDIYIAPKDLNNYRLTNITKFRIKLNDHYAFKWLLREEYNNRPPAGIQKNDLSFTTSLEYTFNKSFL
ncbi:MAG: DUF481 domain-containing protein [bacterium]